MSCPAADRRVDAILLASWVQRELEVLCRDQNPAPSDTLAVQLGISGRTLYCWERQVTSAGHPAFTWPAQAVEQALAHADVPLWQVFGDEAPAPADERFCRRCREYVLVGADGACPWCESATDERAGRPQAYCAACDLPCYPANDGCCTTCGGATTAIPWEGCGCGCEELVRRFDRYGNRRRYRHGHNPRSLEDPDRVLPAAPFADYLAAAVRSVDPVLAVAAQHGLPRAEVTALIEGRETTVNRKRTAVALERARRFGQARGKPGRAEVPLLRELYGLDRCSCGARKAMHAGRCRSCAVREGTRLPAPPRALDDATLAEAVRLQGQGQGPTEIARRLLARTSYTSERSAAVGIGRYLRLRKETA